MLVASGMGRDGHFYLTNLKMSLTNLKNINYQEDAFWNLFRFMSGGPLCGQDVFFAVTPDFCTEVQVAADGQISLGFLITISFDTIPTFFHESTRTKRPAHTGRTYRFAA